MSYYIFEKMGGQLPSSSLPILARRLRTRPPNGLDFERGCRARPQRAVDSWHHARRHALRCAHQTGTHEGWHW